MALDDTILSRIEKQMEGNGLAMAAVAEVLQKMDARLEKAETEDDEDRKAAEEDKYMEEAAMEKALLIKSVTNEVVNLFKEGSDQGMDVSPDPATKAKSEGPSTTGGADADDSEKAVTIDSKTENVQHVIQAMQLQLSELAKDMDDDRDPDMTDEDKDEEDGSDENVENGYYGKLENMQKQILQLTKSVQKNNSMESAIQKETETRLRKMGFREETSLQRPNVINYDAMGIDNTTPIRKSQATDGDDVVDQLTNLSYKQLREMQMSIEAGNTDGVPQELL